MVHNDAAMSRKVLQKSVGSAVQIISSNDFVARSQEASNNIEGSHARRDDKGAVRVHNLGQMPFKVRASRVAGACVVIFLVAAGRGVLLESGRLRSELVLVLVLKPCRCQKEKDSAV